jgi:hypothetical protein
MKAKAALLLAMVVTGCSHTQIDVNGGASVQAHTHSNAVAALLITGMFLAAASEEAREPRPLPSFATFADWFRGTPPTPPMDPQRAVLEQDCTGPVDLTVTLKCR